MKISLFKRVLECLKKEGHMKTNILGRIFRLSFISLLIVMSCLILVFYLEMNQIMTQNYSNQLTGYSEIMSDSVSQWANLIKDQIENQVDDAELVNPKTTLEEKKLLLEEAASYTEFKDFSISYADGKTFNDTDISERDYFKEAMQGKTFISSPVLRKTDNSLTIMVGSKMKVDGFEGIIYGGLDVDFFSSLLENINIGDSGAGFIVDSKGVLISYPDEEYVLNSICPQNDADPKFAGLGTVTSKMAKGEKSIENVIMPDGNEYLIAYSPVSGDEGWSVGVMLKKSEISNKLNECVNKAVIIAIILLVIAAVANFIVSTNIAYPIKQASQKLKELADGNLSSKEVIKPRADETGELLRNVEETRNNLNAYIEEIGMVLMNIIDGNLDISIDREYLGDFNNIKENLLAIIEALNATFLESNNASVNLFEGARQVETASQALAASSTEQASAVVEITASIEGISKNTDENTEDVIRVNQLAQMAKKEADDGNVQMSNMVDAMNEISLSSQSIAKIMKVIDDISFQTNILALNASVEAARAGIHGRGFAVVADEVRNLAGKSSEAACEIAEMIDDTIKKIEVGSDIASKTADELGKIVSDIDEIADIMNHIAEMSREQSESLSQVNIGIEQISDAVQNNSATSEETAASATELLEQADVLRRMIGYYKLKN